MFSPQFNWTYFLPSIAPPASGATPVEGNIKLTLYPSWYKDMLVSWTVPDSWAALSPEYRVYRSRTQGGSYELLTPSAISAQSFTDEKASIEASKYSHYHYYVEALLSDGRVLLSNVISPTPRMGDWQRIRKDEINRREWILLRRYTGQDSLILRRLQSGARCKHCWDDISKSIVKSKCPYCYGVSFECGYHPGLPTKIQYDATVENKAYSYLGRFEQNQLGAWTIAFPDVEATDIIVRLTDNTVYRVEQIQNTMLQGEVVRQIMRVTQLSKQDVEYELIEREANV